jgi:hypothetical protein
MVTRAKSEKRPPYRCFRTVSNDPNRRIKCFWNEVEQRYDKGCKEVDVSECIPGTKHGAIKKIRT